MSNEIIKKTDPENTQSTALDTSQQIEERELFRIRPRWNSSRDKEAYHLHVDLPGVDKTSVRLKQEKDLLILEADRELPENDLELLAGQAAPDGYKLRIKLPEDIDSKKLQGSLNKGRLDVVLPIRSDELPREIPLN